MNLNEALKILNLKNFVNPEIIKKQYRELAKKYHPDLNIASTHIMQVINQAYEIAKDYTGLVDETEQHETNYPEKLSTALNAILHIVDLDIEICGGWIWVRGNTREYKELLKSNGFKWSPKKIAWYYHLEPKSKRYGYTYDMDKIRYRYGSISPKRGKINSLGY